MEANAPEKIYKTITYLDERKSGVVKWKDKPVAGAENIEYTRTDVIIEKAEKFFEENIQEEECKIGCSEWIELRSDYKSLDSFIRAFRKYVKGENE